MTIWHRESVVVGHIILVNPVGNLVLEVVLDVAMQMMRVEAVRCGSASLLSPLVEVCIPDRLRGKSLKDEKTRETESPLEAALKDGGIDAATLKLWPVHLKVAVAVL